MINKRGLSDIVTTSLIILLAVVAVVIVWSFVKPLIDQPGGDEAVSCLKVDIKPVECKIDYSASTVSNNKITLESGSQSPKVDDVRFLYYDDKGYSITDGTRDMNCPVKPLEKKLCQFAASMTPPPVRSNKVAVAAIINGNPCSPSVQITCT